MPAARVALLMTALVLSTGCIRKKPTAVVPPPPKPVAPAALQIPPLSIPQTQVRLPSPQPLDLRALATIEVPAEPLPAGATPTSDLPFSLRRNVPPPAPGPIVVVPPPKPAETPAVVEEIPEVQERLKAEEQSELEARLSARRREAQDTLNQFRQPKSERERVAVGRIKSFLDRAEEALKRRDMRQADALSEFAVIVARELKGAK